MCSTHYQRWRKYGDPSALRSRPPTFCTVDGCSGPAAGLGYCLKHYTRWRRYGKTCLPHLPRDLADGERWCTGCKQIRSVAEFGTNRSREGGFSAECKACSRRRRREYVQAHKDIEAAAARRRYEADPEKHRQQARDWRRRNPDAVRAATAARRARRLKATTELVSPAEVFARDAWCCGICGQQIDPLVRYPSLESASIDHVLPLIRGGSHSMDNVQAAHLSCNLRKKAKVGDVAWRNAS